MDFSSCINENLWNPKKIQEDNLFSAKSLQKDSLMIKEGENLKFNLPNLKVSGDKLKLYINGNEIIKDNEGYYRKYN